jgi:5-methylcytosine-specific restriction endonuclease McrBC regulatory subunit McrC
MMEFPWDDFLSDLCRDALNGIDRTRIKERTGLSENTLSCFTLRNKTNIPNMKQWAIILEEAYKQRPENVRQAQKRWCARFGMFAETLETLSQDVKRNNGG